MWCSVKYYFSLAVIALLVSAPSFADDWAQAEVIINTIQAPNIPNNTFNITQFNAVEGGKRDCLPALTAAIEAASAAGGGKIVVPSGTWLLNGPIHLKSKINLYLSEGSRLLFSANPKHYLPAVRSRWEGTELFTYSPFIYAANVTDVAITGPGILDGNKKSKFRRWAKKQKKNMDALRHAGVFAEGTYLRPTFVQFFHAKRVLLEGYTIINAPFWINHLVYTQYATVRDLFRTGDDSVVIKSGRDMDGRTIGVPSENIVVRNNDMGGEDGIALGSEMSGGIKNVFFENNILRTGASAIRFKANLDRGGLVEHIRVRNFKVEAFENLFWFQLNYPGELGGNFPSTYRDIVFENFSVENAETFLEVHAPNIAPLTDVTFKNITVNKVNTPLILENATNLTFENVQLEAQTINGTLNWAH